MKKTIIFALVFVILSSFALGAIPYYESNGKTAPNPDGAVNLIGSKIRIEDGDRNITGIVLYASDLTTGCALYNGTTGTIVSPGNCTPTANEVCTWSSPIFTENGTEYYLACGGGSHQYLGDTIPYTSGNFTYINGVQWIGGGWGNIGANFYSIQGINFTIETYAPPVITEDIDITLEYPEDDDVNDSDPIFFGYTPDADSLIIENCSLYINHTLNQTDSSVTNGTINEFNLSLEEGSYLWGVSCVGNNSKVYSPTANFTLNVDFTSPTFDGTNFTNNTVIYGKNITYSFNFSDPNMYSFLAQLNGVTINNVTGITSTSYVANVTINYTDLNLYNTLYIKAADGHTKEYIEPYEYDNGLFGNKLNYKTRTSVIEITAQDGSFLDSFTSEKLKDRYTFNYEPSNKNKEKYVFIVRSDSYIDIVTNPESKWHTWLITGDNWIDFYEEERPNEVPKYKRISGNEIEVTIKSKNNNDKFKFSSVGDLNIVELTYIIYGLNVTTIHSAFVTESQHNTPYLYVGVNNSNISVNASLIYNGTTYINPNKSSVSELYTFYQGVHAPNISNTSVSDVKTFQWNITTIGGSSLVTLSQTIYNILIDNCSTYSIHAINFTMYEDANDAKLNTSLDGYFELWVTQEDIRYFNISWGYANNHSLCTANGTYNVYAQLEFDSPHQDYNPKTYYLYNTTLDNNTRLIDLYSTANSTYITFSVTDENDNDVEDVYIHVMNYFIESNSYKTSEILKTDEQGDSLGNVILDERWYKFFLYYQGNLMLESSPTKLSTTTRNFRITLGDVYLAEYDAINDLYTTLTFNNDTKNFTFTWSDPSGVSRTGCLKVYKTGGTTDTLVADSCETAASGSIIVGIGSDFDGYIFRASGYIRGSRFITLNEIADFTSTAYLILGEEGLFVVNLLRIAIVTIGVWNPIFAIMLLAFTDLGLILAGLFKLSWLAFVSYIAMGILTVWRMSKK